MTHMKYPAVLSEVIECVRDATKIVLDADWERKDELAKCVWVIHGYANLTVFGEPGPKVWAEPEPSEAQDLLEAQLEISNALNACSECEIPATVMTAGRLPWLTIIQIILELLGRFRDQQH